MENIVARQTMVTSTEFVAEKWMKEDDLMHQSGGLEAQPGLAEDHGDHGLELSWALKKWWLWRRRWTIFN